MSNPIINFIKQKAGWVFQKRVTSTNHDYPFHDFKSYENEEEEDSIIVCYRVGEGNVNAQGDQHKYFVAKRLLVYSADGQPYVRFNHSNNVTIPVSLIASDSAGGNFTWFMEFHANINIVWIVVPAQAQVNIYCEGVLPEEARDAE